MKNQSVISFVIILALFGSCQKSRESEEVEANTKPEVKTIHLIAQDRPGVEPRVMDMPVDKGLDHLELADPDTVAVDSSELIIGIFLDNTPMAIPLNYLSGFEVANLYLESSNYLVTWCPLVGSARIFEGDIHGDGSGFDFGRGLSENNLLIVDRKTNTVWNQLSCSAIEGDLEGNQLSPLPTIQSTWGFWKRHYPDTKLIVNQDTTEAVFPSFIFEKQYYNNWVPGNRYPEYEESHNLENLGLGLETGTASVFFPVEELFNQSSPVEYELAGQSIRIQFDQAGVTAWAENMDGELLPSTMVYDWAWMNFYPDTEVYRNNSKN